MKFFVLAILIASAYTVSEKYQCVRDVLDLGPMNQGRGISIRGSFDVKTLLTQFDNLPKEVQNKIENCKLNLAPAQARCEGAYGKGNCEEITKAAFQTKCDKYFKRVGCCHCAMECPEGYKEDDYHCIKPDQKTTTVYESMDKCKAAGKTCEQRGNKFTDVCGIQFKRVGVNNCLPVCPEGWHDEGKRCRKPADYRMAQPFLWQQGDN
jgi:hypothetical protein